MARDQTDPEMVVATNAIHALDYTSGLPRPTAQSESPVTLADLGIGVLFDQLLDAVVVARLSTGRIVLWNAAAQKLFGYTTEEAVGSPIEMLMPEPMSHVHRMGLERYLRTGHGLIIDAGAPVEMPARTKSGEEIRIELSLSELAGPDDERFAVAVVRNAMLRKQLELTTLELTQARVARSEAETAVRARDEILDSLAATLEGGAASDDLEPTVSALEVLKNLRRGASGVRQVDIDIVDVVHAAADTAKRRLAAKRLALHLPPSAPASCDPLQLRIVLDQVLNDLAARGTDRVELRVEQLSPDLVRISALADKKVGRADTPTVSLLVARMLMQRIGGTLHIEPPSGAVVEVVMTLPASRRERRAATRRRSR